MEEGNLYKKVLNERSEMQNNDHLEEFIQFNKQEKQTLSFTHISKTGDHMYNRNPSQKHVITC